MTVRNTIHQTLVDTCTTLNESQGVRFVILISVSLSNKCQDLVLHHLVCCEVMRRGFVSNCDTFDSCNKASFSPKNVSLGFNLWDFRLTC